MALPKVAELLKCSVEDLVHWASNGDTKVGVIYETDIFFRPPVFELGKGSSNKRLEDFSGFAFIHAGYMTSGEVSGICKFNGLELPDGRMIVFTPNDTPSEYQKYQMIGIELHQLYMRQEEFEALQITQADTTPENGTNGKKWTGEKLKEVYEFYLNEKNVKKTKAFKKATATHYGVSTKRIEQLLKEHEKNKPNQLGLLAQQLVRTS